ncbi:MAG: tol-pal system protein YbgF [Desulfonatronovibrio sp.]
MQSTRLFLLGIACFFLTACVTSQSDMDVLRRQVQSLEKQQQTYKQEMTQKIEDLQNQMETVDQAISESGGSVREKQANLWAEVESMRTQVATLTGRMDSLERETSRTMEQDREEGQLLKDLQSKTRELDRSVQMIASQLGVDMGEAEPVPPPELEEQEKDGEVPAVEPGPAMSHDSAQPLYQRALDSFYDRNYEQAQSLWEEFTDNFPDHALTPNAYFWQGESYYQMEDYAQAVLAYQEVITNFPESGKLSSSMLKQGMSFFQLERDEAGELVLSELVKKFPDTAEARRARAFMTDNQ